MLAAKTEEVILPNIDCLRQISKNQYSVEGIIEME